MILQLTDDEVNRILDSLDTYSCHKNLQFQDSGGHDEEARTDRDSADWVWQKVKGQRDLQFDVSVADALIPLCEQHPQHEQQRGCVPCKESLY